MNPAANATTAKSKEWFFSSILFFSRSRYCLKVFLQNESDLFNVFVSWKTLSRNSFFYEHKKAVKNGY